MCERKIEQIQTGRHELTYKEGSEVVLGLVKYSGDAQVYVQYLRVPEKEYLENNFSVINKLGRSGSATFKREEDKFVLSNLWETDNKSGCECHVERKPELAVIEISRDDGAKAFLTYGNYTDELEIVRLTMPPKTDIFAGQPEIGFCPFTRPGKFVYIVPSLSSSLRPCTGRWEIDTKIAAGIIPPGGVEEEIQIQHELPGMEETLTAWVNSSDLSDPYLAHNHLGFQRKVIFKDRFPEWIKTKGFTGARLNVEVRHRNPVALMGNKPFDYSEDEMKKYIELTERIARKLNGLFFSKVEEG